MKIAINGAGVAGPTLAYWLRRYGHEPVLFEKASALRTGGYVVDFWGLGYQVAQKMGIMPALRERGYSIEELRVVSGDGRVEATMGMDAVRSALGGRIVSIPRGDIVSTIMGACDGVEVRFGLSVDSIEQHRDRVLVTLSDGTRESFDLLVGADGVHSRVRELALAPDAACERDLGCFVAALELPGYRPRDELVYVMHTRTERQVARMALRDDATLFLFICRTGCLPVRPRTADEARAALRAAFAGMEWEVPEILGRLDQAPELYFDGVQQVRLPAWTSGRVALVGDAAACVSLLGGEGTGLAMVEAYVLAGELHRCQGDHTAAFRCYEDRLRGLLAAKQRAAQRNIGFFVPSTRVGQRLRDWMVSLSSRPLVARGVAAWSLRDRLTLPDYE